MIKQKQQNRPRKTWVYCPSKLPKPKVPDNVKAEVANKANELIEELKPLHIKKPPKGHKWNYIVDLYTKWIKSYFYFCAKYACPGPNSLSPFFEACFARIEYTASRRFNLSYKRHTGEWIELEQGLTMGECLKAIRETPHYQP